MGDKSPKQQTRKAGQKKTKQDAKDLQKKARVPSSAAAPPSKGR